jgi:molybdopterin/thiamine biosynthesis adenylyltransferase
MSDRARFYAERDRRTVEYGIDAGFLESQVAVVVGEEAAASRPGQVATLALVNMLARIHRSIALVVPPSPLVARTLVPGDDLPDVLVATATAIDPFISIELVDRPPSDTPCIGLGAGLPAGLAVYVGAQGAAATLADAPQSISTTEATILGAGLGACLAAADLLYLVTSGRAPHPRRVSVWGFGEGDAAGAGPEVTGPVDVGDVLVAGAGAVGSCLSYWLREIGVVGSWDVVDGDIIRLHNTNRSLGVLATDAGWPTGDPARKAQRAADLIGATPHVQWYHEWIESHPTSRPDLVLPLANDHGVRHLIGQRGEPVLLSATTSPHETAALHRQIPGRDDCMDCRFPDATIPKFECSTGPVQTSEGTSTDAALPFLSATAGLLLASGLLQLQARSIGDRAENQWTLWVATANRSWQMSRRACATGCQNVVPMNAVRAFNRNSRWREFVD